MSNLTITNKADTEVNNDGDSQSLETPIKNNQSGTELRDTNNPMDQVQIGVNTRQFQHDHSTQTKRLKIPPSGKEYLFSN